MQSSSLTPSDGFPVLEILNPISGYQPRPANDPQLGRRDRVPTSAPSVLKRPPFEPLPAGTGSLQKEVVAHGFGINWNQLPTTIFLLGIVNS